MKPEHVGDWTIRAHKEGDTDYVVDGWGLRWYCETIDQARKTAELLNRVSDSARDVSSLA